ncbi:hypothetical protein [Consotaella aegiceratis]|uniref:hypothetical protein n=1 Tax=Consotaella aegiceratis TaxID=3097961 RepID=UPI002F40CB4A
MTSTRHDRQHRDVNGGSFRQTVKRILAVRQRHEDVFAERMGSFVGPEFGRPFQ